MSDKHWFHSKSPAAQKAYIAAHPKSIYAKQAKVARGDKQRAKTATANRAAHNAVIKERMERRAAHRAHLEEKAARVERLAKKRVKPNKPASRTRVKPNR